MAEKLALTSDNWAPASPEVIASILRVNEGSVPPYGRDNLTASLSESFTELFEKDVEVIPVPTSSAGNGLSLSFCTRGYGCIVSERRSHVISDEAGAPEFYSGSARMLGLQGDSQGKIRVQDLEDSFVDKWLRDVNHSKPQVLSVAQLTDCGTLYNSSELSALSAYCKERGMWLHLDGTRFANALASLGISPAAATWKVGVDIMTFGVTKNGGLSCDAVVIFSDKLREEAWRMLKRSGGTYSKMRYATAQLLGYIENGQWLERASHANAMAKKLSNKFANISGCELMYQVNGNMIFACLEDKLVATLEDVLSFGRMHKNDFRVDGQGRQVYRFVFPWDTPEETLDFVLARI